MAVVDSFVIFHYMNWGLWEFLVSIWYGNHSSAIAASSAALKEITDTSWKAQLSAFIMLLLKSLHLVFVAVGSLVEKCLNMIDVNGGFLKILYKISTRSTAEIIWPKPGSSNYWSIIGHLDPRIELDRTIAINHGGGREIGGSAHSFFPDKSAPESVLMAELCMMSSKLAYENQEVVKTVVKNTWNMNFVAQYNCWNEPQQANTTQVFIANDRPQDARVIVVAFRGTQPFSTFNWMTNLDFSWYSFEGLGRVHAGFLEALGLVTRTDMETYANLQKKLLQPIANRGGCTSGLPEDITTTKLLAYDVVTLKLKELLHVNPEAKVYITGHSMGGALACLYSALLYYAQEMEVAERIGGVFTYGQPKVGNDDFVDFYDQKLIQKANRYFRVVYKNDLVPRLPYHDSPAWFQHAGICRYFNSFYYGELVKEVPYRDYLSIIYRLPMTLSAMWELIYNAFSLPFLQGGEYFETKSSMLLRVAGLLFPGLSSHSPVNYVNSIRLGTSANSQAFWD